MRKSIRIAAAAAFAAALMFTPQKVVSAQTTTAVELDNVSQTDSVGNVFYAGEATTLDNADSKKDVYMAGNNCRISNSEIAQDALVAGNTLSFNDTTINGSMRAAGYSISMDNTEVGQNVTAAASSISVGPNSSMDAAIFAASSVTFEGTCGDLKAYAGSVTVNGVVTGDAEIEADKVTIGPDAVIKGNLKVSSSNEPNISDGAEVGNLEYTKTASCDTAEEAVKTVSIGARIASKLLSRVYWIPALVLVAFIFCLVFGKALNGSGEMVLKKPAVMLGSGAITLVALPVALILLCITFIGLPLAGLVTLIVLPIMFFAVTFTGAALGRVVFKTLHPWLASIIGTAILVFVRIIPIIGGLIVFASLIFTLGYLIQICYAEIKTSNPKKQAAAEAVEAEAKEQ